MLYTSLEPSDWSEDFALGGSTGPEPANLQFRLLGPLEVLKDGTDCAPTAPKILQLLALLLLNPGKIVQTSTIIKELWPEAPPRSVRTTMQTYIWQLRRCIETNELAGDGEEILRTRHPGYLMRIDPAQVDVFGFERLYAKGRQLLSARRYPEAAGVLRSALAVWGGPPMANVQCGPVLSAYAIDLEEQQRGAQQLRIQAEIEAGMYREIVGELRSLTATNPLDEGLHGQLMRTLSLSGRRVEALTVYRRLRAKLNEELGLEPCAELQTLHQELLSEGDRS